MIPADGECCVRGKTAGWSVTSRRAECQDRYIRLNYLWTSATIGSDQTREHYGRAAQKGPQKGPQNIPWPLRPITIAAGHGCLLRRGTAAEIIIKNNPVWPQRCLFPWPVRRGLSSSKSGAVIVIYSQIPYCFQSHYFEPSSLLNWTRAGCTYAQSSLPLPNVALIQSHACCALHALHILYVHSISQYGCTGQLPKPPRS
jgi:hypothetical protein